MGRRLDRTDKRKGTAIFGVLLDLWASVSPKAGGLYDLVRAPDPDPVRACRYVEAMVGEARRGGSAPIALVLSDALLDEMIADPCWYWADRWTDTGVSFCGLPIRYSNTFASWILMDDGTTEEL